MNTRTELGKIESVYFGIGGYQDAQVGLHVSLQCSGVGVSSSNCAWDAETIQWSEHCKWTEKDRDASYAKIVRYISKLLKEAKVDSIDKLKGAPVEVTLEGMALISWRILTEVL